MRTIGKILAIGLAFILIAFAALAAFGVYEDQKQCGEDLSATHDLVGQAVADHALNRMQQAEVRKALATMKSAYDDFDAKRTRAIGIYIAMHLSSCH